MTDPNDRETLEDLMVRYVLGELAPNELDDMRRLLAERPELRDEIARLERTLGSLPYAEVTAPPPHLRARILDAAAAQRAAARPTSPVVLADHVRKPATAWTATAKAPAASTSRPSLMHILGSIAAVLVLALAWDGQRLRQELQLQRDVAATLQQPNVVRQFALRGTGISLAVGTAVLDLDAKRAAVAIRGLPKLPAGQVYRLWARIGDGAVPCGQFNADADGAVVSQFTIPVDAYTAPLRELFVNVEPAAQGSRPVGRTVMVGT